MLIVPGALKLWAEKGLEAAELEEVFKDKSHVTRNDTEKLLRERGMLEEVRGGKVATKEKKGSAKAGGSAGRIERLPCIARGGAPATLSETAVDPLLDDKARLDGNRIEIAWPQTRPGEGTRLRVRIGTVRYRPNQERHKQGTIYLVEFERSAKTASKGLRLRKTNWAKLKDRKYRVLAASTPIKPPYTKWTHEELAAVRMRADAEEFVVSIGLGLGRTEGSINRQLRLQKKGYAPAVNNGKRIRSGVTKDLVERAMQTLPDLEGTASEISAALLELAKKEGRELDTAVSPGEKTRTRWQQTVSMLLAHNKDSHLFKQLVQKSRRGTSQGMRNPVYRYVPPLGSVRANTLAPTYGISHTPNVGGPSRSKRTKSERLAGGDRRHGD